jgi:hypothetical protein
MDYRPMKIRICFVLILIFQFTVTWGQGITLEDLIYFQTTKNSLKIDSVLLTKDKWDCNCYRDDGHLEWIREWIYDLPGSTKENVDKDYIKLVETGYGFSSTITFYTTDKKKAIMILEKMKTLKLLEEKVQVLANDSISARISFFVAEKVAIETVTGENKKSGLGKYAFTLMDKADYLKGLTIK